MRSSIRGKLILGFVFLTLLTAGVMGGLGLSLVDRYGEIRESAVLEANAEAIARQAAPYLEGEPDPRALLELAEGAAFLLDARVRILDAETAVLADTGLREGGGELIWLSGGSSGGPVVAWPGTEIVEVEVSEAQRHLFVFKRELHGLGEGIVGITAAEQLAPPAVSGIVEVEALPSVKPASMISMIDGDALGEDVQAETVRIELRGSLDHGAMGDHLARIIHGGAKPVSLPRSPQPFRFPVGTAAAPAGFVELSQTPDVRASMLGTTARAFGLAALGAILLSGLAATVVSRSLTRPIAGLEEAAERMGAGDLGARAPEQSSDEIGRLSARFNDMADRLQGSFDALAAERDSLQRFIADASHELRTPITALRNYNALLVEDAEAESLDRRVEFLREQEAQIDRLTWVTRNLLDLSRLDAGLVELELEIHPAAEIAAAAVRPLEGQAAARGITIECDPSSELDLRCDASRVEMALANLVDNAVKYAPAESRVRLSFAAEHHADGRAGCSFRVMDEGAGLPPELAEQSFERFYRGPNSAGVEGSGLGLAIVQGIARAHDGEVRVEPVDAWGSCFTIWLPDEGPRLGRDRIVGP